MDYSELNAEEKAGRKAIADGMRGMILSQMPVQSSDETSLITDYRGFYLQISFSPLHPLMVFSFTKALQKPLSKRQYELMNELKGRGAGHLSVYSGKFSLILLQTT